MNVVIRNLPGDVSQDEIMETLKEAGVPVKELTFTNEGDPDKGTVVVSMDTSHAGAQALAKMVNGKLWKGRTLEALVMREFTGEGKNA
jgi:hypothetical protein